VNNRNMETRAKRAYGRGYIRQRGNSFSITIPAGKDPVTKKYRHVSLTVKGTRKDAEKKLTELLHQQDTGSYMKPGKTTLAEYLNRWLSDYVKPNLSPRTAEGYEHICNHHLIPSLGSVTLNGLKPEHLQHYNQEKQSGGLNAQTVRHHHTALHKALQTAVEWGLLARNPADAVKPPKAQHPEMQTWNRNEVNQFLEAAKSTPYYALFYTLLYTGLRRSEILALRWQDIDFIYSQISVSRSMHYLKGGKVIFRQTKTDKSKRTVKLTPSTFLVLDEYRKNKEAESILTGKPLSDSDLVFSDIDGKPFLPNTVTHAWIKLVRHTGLKSIRLHDARHTHASLMLRDGIHPKVVQERLGHSSISITLDTYSHVAPGLQEAAAKRFDDAMQINHNEVVVENWRQIDDN
jgi:integrase